MNYFTGLFFNNIKNLFQPGAIEPEYQDSEGNFWIAVLATSVFKFLFINSYRSTDFEVHRNWLAITYSLPLKDWYYEKTSEWTLDYPPLFAYFELLLSQLAQYFDMEMLKTTNLNYASDQTIVFQKGSVILCDVVLAYGILQCASAIRSSLPAEVSSSNFRIKLFALIFINGGLFMVDQIHFQYNGFLFGILLLSIGKIVQGKCFQGALLFAALLNFKHIFLYMAPAFGVYLFAKYCYKEQKSYFPIRMDNFMKLASIVITVFVISFGAFYRHIPQILSRLFPFRRGLCHAYWAPNFWAAYSSMDLLLNFFLKTGKSSLTGGLVGENPLTVLPSVLPIHTFLVTLLFSVPAMYKIWEQPTERHFIFGVIATAWTSFMFGYHVHEKAILNILIPFALVSFIEPKIFMISLAAGTFSLFPLLFTPFEIILKLVLFIFTMSISFVILKPSKFHFLEILYLFGFIPLYCIENFGHFLLPKYPFLPLICVSDYCFVGIVYCYLVFYWRFLHSGEVCVKSRTHQFDKKFSGRVKTSHVKFKGKSKPKLQ